MFIVKLNTPQDKLEWPVTDQTPRILAAEGLGRPARECDRQSVWSHNQEEEDFYQKNKHTKEKKLSHSSTLDDKGTNYNQPKFCFTILK